MDIDVMLRQVRELMAFKRRAMPMLEAYEDLQSRIVRHPSGDAGENLRAAAVLRNVRKVASVVQREK